MTAPRQTAAVAAISTSPSTPATTEPTPYEKLSIKKSDIPSTLILTGSQTQDVPVPLHAPEGTSDEAVDHHSVGYLAMLVARDKAASTTYATSALGHAIVANRQRAPKPQP